ncbi:hypothetical protein QL285_031186 [Trifolium repens]|nr:hypothetical protein QL285_031186 [Trifolium repens]
MQISTDLNTPQRLKRVLQISSDLKMVRDSRIRENPLTLSISHPTPIRPGGTIKQQQHPSTRSVYIPRPFGRIRTKNQGQEQIQTTPGHPSTGPHLTAIRRQHSTTPPLCITSNNTHRDNINSTTTSSPNLLSEHHHHHLTSSKSP